MVSGVGHEDDTFRAFCIFHVAIDVFIVELPPNGCEVSNSAVCPLTTVI